MAGFRHVVTLTFDDSATAAQVETVAAVLRELPHQIPELLAYEVGIDAELAPGNASMVVVADCADQAGYETYRDHPAHQAAIADHIKPILVARSAVQHMRTEAS